LPERLRDKTQSLATSWGDRPGRTRRRPADGNAAEKSPNCVVESLR
jgi:hypothetical protein